MTMPTKDQERKALGKIKKILEELGNDPETSYIVRAFDGCIEHAEENIEFDFGNSWKAQALDYKKAAEHYAAEAERFQKENERLKKKALTTAEAGTIKAILNIDRNAAESKAREAAKKIVEKADDPNGAEFSQAVQEHRTMQKRAEDCESLISRILETMNA